MPSKMYKEIIRVLKANGCHFVRQGKGSHEIWLSPLTDKKITIATSLKSEFLQKKILKEAGIEKN